MANHGPAWNKGLSTKALGKSRPKSLWKTYDCPNCGGKFSAYPSQGRVYCSTSCRSSFVAKRDGVWNKGKFTTKSGSRQAFYRSVRKAVIERDKNICQVCFGYTDQPHVDHIESWAESKNLRFEINNCRTLCMPCHYYLTFKKKMPTGTLWGYNYGRRIKP